MAFDRSSAKARRQSWNPGPSAKQNCCRANKAARHGPGEQGEPKRAPQEGGSRRCASCHGISHLSKSDNNNNNKCNGQGRGPHGGNATSDIAAIAASDPDHISPLGKICQHKPLRNHVLGVRCGLPCTADTHPSVLAIDTQQCKTVLIKDKQARTTAS